MQVCDRSLMAAAEVCEIRLFSLQLGIECAGQNRCCLKRQTQAGALSRKRSRRVERNERCLAKHSTRSANLLPQPETSPHSLHRQSLHLPVKLAAKRMRSASCRSERRMCMMVHGMETWRGVHLARLTPRPSTMAPFF